MVRFHGLCDGKRMESTMQSQFMNKLKRDSANFTLNGKLHVMGIHTKPLNL